MSILKVSIRQIKAARSLLAWSQGDLARSAGVSEPTVKRLEASDGHLGGRATTGDKLRAALESAGVEFIPENGGGAGVRLLKRSTTPTALQSPDRHLEAVLSAFATKHLPKAMEQEGVGELQFVRAGSQATLLEGGRTIGMVTVRPGAVHFNPALEYAGESLTEEDVWNWVIAAWRRSRTKPVRREPR